VDAPTRGLRVEIAETCEPITITEHGHRVARPREFGRLPDLQAGEKSPTPLRAWKVLCGRVIRLVASISAHPSLLQEFVTVTLLGAPVEVLAVR
jgi:hypothetical protein